MGAVIERIKQFGLFCIRWRYLIALVVFVFCVAFKLHGSSISMYNVYFENTAQYNSETMIFGRNRPIRGDEWLVQTPLHMSQSFNNFEKESDRISLEGQDMMVTTNAPVLDISVVAKPYTWGYLMFGNEYGLSWYWCMKYILLLLVSFDFCMIITKKNKIVSLLGMLLLALAPPMQWWFSTSVVDVFLWGMALMVLGYNFFVTKNKVVRNLIMVTAPIVANTYIITLFPSLQIPVAFFLIAVFVAILLRDKKAITFKKKDIWQLVAMAIIMTTLLIVIVIGSSDALFALANTVYPGSRITLGDTGGLETLFTNIVTITTPLKDITYSNNCEISSFVQFAPVFLMLFPMITRKVKKDYNLLLGKTILASVIIVVVFMIAGFPAILARLTLFSYVNRIDIVYGFVAVIFTVWGVDMVWRRKIVTKKQAAIVAIIYMVCCSLFIGEKELSYFSWWIYAIMIVVLGLIIVMMLRNRRRLFLIGITLVMVLSGGLVNPVAHGTASLYNHPLEKKIREIAGENPDAYWLTINWGDMLVPLALVNGAKVLNAVNVYPDYEKWEIIDPDGKYDAVYNRYAHLYVSLSNEDTALSNNNGNGYQEDVISLSMNYNDLLKWPVEYLLVTSDPGVELTDFEKIYDDIEGDYHIWRRVK